MVKLYELPQEPPEPSKHVDLAEMHDAPATVEAFADSYNQTVEDLKSLGVPDGHELGGPMVDVDGVKHDVRPDDIESIEPHPENSKWRKVALIGGAVVVMTIGGLLVARKKVGQRPTS